MKKFVTFIFVILIGACQHQTNLETTMTSNTQTIKDQTSTPIVGGVETLHIIPFDMPFHARMDTGAETSSIDAHNLRPFERDGEKWISFDITNRKDGITKHFEKPVKRKTTIVRTGEQERRYVVHLDIKMGNELIDAEFSLNDRSKFEYQVLVGRNIINGRFIIDPTLENTMH
ncbi:MAG: hypothetical protein E7020_01085 [Alphaproteobacteria bacterium]|nr:hypothetical protein [Alphaproteobacteria bacterium]